MDRLILVSSIRHKEKLNIVYNNEIYFGGNQSWLQGETKVFGGCGPICAFNLLKYYGLDHYLATNQRTIVEQLEEMYHDIKPTEIYKYIPNYILDKKLLPPTLGVRSLSRFKQKFINFADHELLSKQVNIHEFRFDNAREHQLEGAVKFIRLSLDSNHPLCFLNAFHKSKLYLSHGLPKGKQANVHGLDEFELLPKKGFMTHWVLVTGLYQSEDLKEYYLECSTWGKVAYFKLSDFYQKQNWKNHIIHSGMISIEL